jgi:superfamily II DNA or RNA helicase
LSVHLHNLINAAGGQAEHVIIQRFGRGLRVADDKELLNYYDFVFEINEYLYTHSQRRIRILEHEGHNIEIKKSLDF